MEPFQTNLNNYLTTIRDAKSKGSSHDYLRQIFIDFARNNFKVNPTDVDLEKGIKGTKIRGSIDALYQDIVFEFKRDLRIEGDTGREELERYLRSLGDKQPYFGVLTDALTFQTYQIQESKLIKIDEINLGKCSPDDAFIWFDSFLFSEKQLAPTWQDVVKRFGDTSFVFNSSFQILNRMLAHAKDTPSYKVKFNEWDKLLAKAYGHSVARSELFLRHTYLSILVKLLAYAALFKEYPKGEKLPEIITGKAFINLINLAEEDFFCWVLVSPLQKDTLELLRGLSQHLAVYDLTKIDQDLLKELYENLVDSATKHDLGEVYTPDWLVELTLREAGYGKGKRILDPACGSGTFLFTAIQLLKEQGISGPELVDEALQNIVGIDVHPLAVTIAKVNYVLALAGDLESYAKAVLLPVYMANSLEAISPSGGEMVSIMVDEKTYFNIPRFMAENPASLDNIIDEMRRYVGGGEDVALDGFSAYLESQGHKDWIYMWRDNLKTMRTLIKEGRDTIWSFILKNYYRPAYLHEFPFDIVAGNPPWLSYRYITDPGYQQQVKQLIFHYELIGKKEYKLFTQMEEATLFFALSADAYLKKGGTIAFVMPRSVLTGAKQHLNFQEMLQHYRIPPVAVTKIIDAEEVSPLFKVPTCVIIANKNGPVKQVNKITLKGSLHRKNMKLAEIGNSLSRESKQISDDKLFPPITIPSVYLKSIKAGASIYPRTLWFVKPQPSPFGINRERPAVKTSNDVIETAKKQWENITLQGEIEVQYLYATMLGSELLPFGFTNLSLVVLPLEVSSTKIRLIKKEEALTKGHSGIHYWLSQVEIFWEKNKKAGTKEDIYQWLDYMRKLTSQHPKDYYTVLYGGAGTNVASCVLGFGQESGLTAEGIHPNGFVADIDTFLYQTKFENEAHYLCSLLNAGYINDKIKEYQTRGAWGERHIYRRPFEVVSIPRFDSNDARHQRLSDISKACHEKVAALELTGKSIGFLRGKVRQQLVPELEEIDKLVKEILSPKLEEK